MSRFACLLAVNALAAVCVGQVLETTIYTGGTPTYLLWNPLSNKVYCSSWEDGRVFIISGADNQLIGSVEFSSTALELAWNSRHNKVYCTGGDGNCVAVISGETDSLVAIIETPAYPNTVVYDETDNKVYVECGDAQVVAVIDGATDSIIRCFHMVQPFNCSVWHPSSNRVFCPLVYDDSVAVIDCRTDSIESMTPIGQRPWSACLNDVSDSVYFGCRRDVYVLSELGDSVVGVIPQVIVTSLCFVPKTNRVLGADFSYGAVYFIDCDSNVVLDSMRTGGQLTDAVADTVRCKVYCSDIRSSKVHVIDAWGDTLLTSVTVGSYPQALAWNRTNSRVYAANYLSGTVSVIRDAAGVSEQTSGPGRGEAVMLGVTPSPARSSVLIELRGLVGNLRIGVYDAAGRRVAAGKMRAGTNQCAYFPWDCRDRTGTLVPSGTYTAVVTGRYSSKCQPVTRTFAVLR